MSVFWPYLGRPENQTPSAKVCGLSVRCTAFYHHYTQKCKMLSRQNKLLSSNSINNIPRILPLYKAQSFTTSSAMTSRDIPITLPNGLSRDRLDAFKPFTNWMKKMETSFSLQSNPSHPFHADPYTVSNAAGETLPAGAFLRGPSVAMLVMLVPEDAVDESERYVVLTVQARIPAGSLAFVELPAGMVDDEGDFQGIAAKEIEQELGLTINAAELTCLSELAAPADGGAEDLPRAMFPSAGGCDEHITIFSYEKKVPRDTLASWTGKLTGLRESGEKITLKLVKMQDLWREGARDAKCLSALALWEGLRREGRI
ncbi:hypothetical protein VHEMI06175 [[Torrubiella] hemipterigena]|uniref:Uncharacterized protein n=1 Tax=[Torrubiella] hemipterigena TaxID=1531966 RepID=A0A0A1TKH2_9HYPO|nr:hypothetical protein VHEMI06175 [[Torrubiella] hemipterigena]